MMGLKIYGESSTMKLERREKSLIFRPRFSLKLIVFLLSFLSLSISVFFIEVILKSGYKASISPFAFGLIVSIVLAITYKKHFRFDSDLKEFIMSKGILGINKTNRYSFKDVESIVLRSKKSFMTGVRLPIRIQKHTLEILLNNEKHILIDRSSDLSLVKKYADAISVATGVTIEEQDQR